MLSVLSESSLSARMAAPDIRNMSPIYIPINDAMAPTPTLAAFTLSLVFTVISPPSSSFFDTFLMIVSLSCMASLS